ncbi:MAG: EVE domain-containing protein [Bacteroidetes bacterium]|nr:EVE domain-containing protein [Bacteroidota bacterium]
MRYWLVKSEPDVYSWDRLVREGETVWDGVRNYQARNNLRDMRKGDQVLFYHSNNGMEVVGIAVVSKESFPDPGSDNPAWLAVCLKPWQALKKPLALTLMKQTPELSQLGLIRQGRLSVMPVSPEEFNLICSLGGHP